MNSRPLHVGGDGTSEVRPRRAHRRRESPRFFSAVVFNIGLAFESLGQLDRPLDVFELAHGHLPSEAARKTIASLQRHR